MPPLIWAPKLISMALSATCGSSLGGESDTGQELYAGRSESGVSWSGTLSLLIEGARQEQQEGVGGGKRLTLAMEPNPIRVTKSGKQL